MAMNVAGGEEYADALDVTFGLETSATGHVPLHELELSLDTFCKEHNEEAPSLTRELLGQFKMTLLQHKGKWVVTGLTQAGPQEVGPKPKKSRRS